MPPWYGPAADVIQGAHGIGEGVDPKRKDEMVNKFWPEGLLIVHAGGQAGLFSAILRRLDRRPLPPRVDIP